MVSTNPLIEVYCTRPNCQDPINTIPEKNLYTKPIKQKFCANCGMPLILEKSFLALRLLVPDSERGGFGRTFLARDLKFPDLPLRVIKQLHPRISPSQSQLTDIEKLFQREASVLGKLTHPQIPRAWAFTSVEAPRDLQESTGHLNQNKTFFYLVQDFIDGQNLAQDSKQKGAFSQAEVVEIMLQLLNILKYVHSEGVIHRDLKPSNIMRGMKGDRLWLIDFGAVKQVVVTGVPAEQSIVIGTPDFAPPEQVAGKAVSASSDLYSLAATCVCLLTGKEAQMLREYHTWNWRSSANVNPQFGDILDRMLLFEPEQRYQSAAEVIAILSALQTNTPPVTTPSPLPSHLKPQPVPTTYSVTPTPQPLISPQPNPPDNRKKLWWVAGAIGVLLGSAIAYAWITKDPRLLADNFFSRGEESLLKERNFTSTLCKQALQEKQEGMIAFEKQQYQNAQRKFQTAINLFRQATNQCAVDPETLIFLNNAKANIKGNPLTIAAVIPGKNRERNTNISEEILRGVASVQETLNNQDGIEGRLLQVVIARDENNGDPNVEDTAPKVAQQLVKNQIPGDRFNGNILGVVGHFTSDATASAGEIYGKEKLVAISPTSTAVRRNKPNPGSKYIYPLSDYVFRTAPNDAIAAADLVDYARQNIGSGNAAIFYNSDQSYSTSLKESFQQKYASLGTLTECDLAETEINNCPIGNDVKLLMLSIGTLEANRASLIISKFKNQPLLGGDSLYNADNISSTFGEQASNLVLAVPIHIERTTQSFRSKSKQLWGTQYVGWRAATAYDATQAIVTALQNLDNPTREGLYEQLKSPFFSATGATGNIEFNRFHDRQVDRQDDNQLGVLVKVQQKCQPQDAPKYQFCLIAE
jgi:ABC-type branched-subunit amino acid transport system substrate-binding protein